MLFTPLAHDSARFLLCPNLFNQIDAVCAGIDTSVSSAGAGAVDAGQYRLCPFGAGASVINAGNNCLVL